MRLRINADIGRIQSTKVLAKQKQRDKSTATIAIKKRTAAIDSRR